MDRTDRSVLVTGGCGYVGSHTIKRLRELGYKPIIVDSDTDSYVKIYRDYTVYRIAILQELPKLTEILVRHNVVACIHFAGSTSVADSTVNPLKYFVNNTSLTAALADKLIECGIKTLVYSSSAAVYGNPGNVKVNESMQCKPINPYGLSKLMMEQICASYAKTHKLRSIGFRYFNAAGADGNLGELRQNETHIIPLAIKAAMTGQSFNLYGTDYDTDDGSCVRDYVHVKDLAEAHVMALEYALNNDICDVYNLGSGVATSNKQLLKCVSKHTNEFVLQLCDERPGDPAYLVADIDKVKQKFDWQPQHSDLNNIIKSAVDFYRSNKTYG